MPEKRTFESAMRRLEEIVQILERGESTLEESLRLFEEGTELAKFCQARLNEAEAKLKVLVKKDDGFQLELV
ncbi:MAG: exodeoxyribonuclease VII small subunit [candidate division KSB1 bacterium]|nr:exodeoxyribonuclease VII small subunit [candidate division KSB1 bacterium]MDZ7294375.1 exodeoxyribonuclease VII small subunit [candidate division KSB1 bacterium]MDZ7338400.1 exodeoxyribonuclease VII small subunit [candidate division KSB1 bacterium]MDZ7385081.1 exodeoxyribonuclease VII small subunit [candidate division KSB1 bacterium]MDZ7391660.1 exodeoxyribonuclease VII small subunit [candidate division KSB1 bacterium]